jgi:hypothetical protein
LYKFFVRERTALPKRTAAESAAAVNVSIPKISEETGGGFVGTAFKFSGTAETLAEGDESAIICAAVVADSWANAIEGWFEKSIKPEISKEKILLLPTEVSFLNAIFELFEQRRALLKYNPPAHLIYLLFDILYFILF